MKRVIIEYHEDLVDVNPNFEHGEGLALWKEDEDGKGFVRASYFRNFAGEPEGADKNAIHFGFFKEALIWHDRGYKIVWL